MATMSVTRRVVAGLLVGVLAGLAIKASGSPALLAIASWIEPLGTLWVNAILMTVIPLVVSTLVAAVGSSGNPQMVRQLGGRAVLLFLVFVLFAAGITALVTPILLGGMSADTATMASLHTGAASAQVHTAQIQTLRQWLTSLVPSNPVRAAADGALLPLVLFTLIFALAITRVPAELRVGLVRFFEAIARAMHVVVEWVLVLAPIGVFALALPLAAQLGVAVAGALGYYVLIASAFPVAFLLLLYPAAPVVGGVTIRRFARAAAPAQAVAFSSRSSLASLPALMEGAEHRLGLPPTIIGFTLPFAVSTFKYCGPVVVIVGALVLGRLYGIAIEPIRLFEATLLASLLSFTIPGIPAGAIIATGPAVFALLGLPQEGIGLLIALDAVPDMVRAPANVTADLMVATILARGSIHQPTTSPVHRFTA
jgi:Na+/H+-dicarboxylate symporter